MKGGFIGLKGHCTGLDWPLLGLIVGRASMNAVIFIDE